jgi:hypothetical protein
MAKLQKKSLPKNIKLQKITLQMTILKTKRKKQKEKYSW